MQKGLRASVVALALTALVAQSTNANAIGLAPAPAAAVSPLVIVYGFGVLFCTGLTFGKQDVWAAKAHSTVTAKRRLYGFLGCIFPPIGLAKLMRGK